MLGFFFGGGGLYNLVRGGVTQIKSVGVAVVQFKFKDSSNPERLLAVL